MVESVFIEVNRNKKFKTTDTLEFFNFIESCFIHRRKKLLNSLMANSNKSLKDSLGISSKDSDKDSFEGNSKGSHIDKKDLIVKMLKDI